jgi:hypothetical protein
MHNYAIVASGWGEFIGSNGVDIDVPAEMTLRPQTDATVRMATIDLDAVMVNFNSGCGNSEFFPAQFSDAKHAHTLDLSFAKTGSGQAFQFKKEMRLFRRGAALPALIANGTVEVDWMDEATQSWRVVSKRPGAETHILGAILYQK